MFENQKHCKVKSKQHTAWEMAKANAFHIEGFLPGQEDILNTLIEKLSMDMNNS